jgi:phosphatidylglycerophosphate synthase
MVPVYILLLTWSAIVLYAYHISTRRGDDYHLETVITRAGLQNLRTHKYASTGYSWMDNFLNPFWTWIVSYVPASVMPNTLTFVGLVCQCVSCVLAVRYSPDMEADITERWVFYAIFLLQFTYETLDAIDGKHARNTGNGSPLGQLFDHGCDSVGAVFVTLCVIVTIRLGSGGWGILVLFLAQFTFFLSQWAEHHTHTVRTYVGYIGVTEAQWAGFAIFVTTGLFGTEHWLWTLGSLLPAWALGPLGGEAGVVGMLQLNHLVMLANISTALFVIWYNARDVYNYTNSWKPFAEFAPLLVICVTALGLKQTATYQAHPALCLIVIGMASSHVTVQMIVCNVTSMRFALTQPVVGGLIVVWAHVTLAERYGIPMLLDEQTVFLSYGCLVAALVARYVYLSISHITQALDIY